MSDPKFGDVVDSNFIYSSGQRDVRKFGDNILGLNVRFKQPELEPELELLFAS